MKYLIRFFPEMTVKSRSVRQQQIKQLKKNIRLIVKGLCEEARIGGCWDLLEVELPAQLSEEKQQAISDALASTPGIHHFMQAQEFELPDRQTLCQRVLESVGQRLQGKTFAVRVQRAGVHEFTSLDLEREIGAFLLKHAGPSRVQLKEPEETVMLQVHHQRVFIVGARREGIGGYPLGTQEQVATLMSGGFDSCVAAYQMLQRGVCTHFIFFRLGGVAHEQGVKEVAHHLWQRYGSSHRVKFVTVPFEAVVEQILTQVDNAQMGVVLKRAMLHCADQLARRLRIGALVTGEAIAQVSSQTLTNLQVIDRCIDRLVLRPLITTHKQTIIDQAFAIGVAEMSARIPEYCGVISQRPTIRARLEEVEAEEAKIDPACLEAAVRGAVIQKIDQVLLAPDLPEFVSNSAAESTDKRAIVVLDVRAPADVEANPLPAIRYPVECLPFYKLHSEFAQLDAEFEYWLYCDQGVMSGLQVQNLQAAGFQNLKVLPAAELTSLRT